MTPLARQPRRIARTTPSAANEWTSIGPEGADVTALAVDPTNPSVVYAGTQNSGIFKTTDGGSWRLLVAKAAIGPFVSTLGIDPNSPPTVYAAMAEGPAPSMGITPKPAAPLSTTGSSVTFKLKVGSGTPGGTYNLVFTATDDSGRQQSATLALRVQAAGAKTLVNQAGVAALQRTDRKQVPGTGPTTRRINVAVGEIDEVSLPVSH
jgi:hypothetical protein